MTPITSYNEGKRLPEVISQQELTIILSAAKNDSQRLAFALGFYECMRVGEIARLRPEDINYNAKLIHIKQSKGHKDRIIPIAPEVYKSLKILPINIGIRGLQKAFKKACMISLNKDINFHRLRHSGITYYLNNGLNTLQVQRIAGHSRSTTTEIYTHIQPTDLVTALWEKKILQQKRTIEPI